MERHLEWKWKRIVPAIIAQTIAIVLCIVATESAFAQNANELRMLDNQIKNRIAQKDYSSAIDFSKRQLALMEKSQGQTHPSVGTVHSNIAWLHEMQGNLNEAEVHYLKAIRVFEAARSEKTQLALCFNNLGQIYCSLGNFEKSKPLHLKALGIREKINPKNPDTVNSLHNLANVHKSLGNYAESESLFKRAIAICETTFGSADPIIAHPLNCLGSLYILQANYSSAEPLLLKSLSIREATFGPEHQETLTALNNLGALYEHKDDYSSAEPLYAKALSVSKKLYGFNNSDTLQFANNLAGIHHKLGKYESAEQLYKSTMAALENTVGSEHPQTAANLSDLGRLYRELARYADAEKCHEKAVAIQQKVFGNDHLATATSLNNLGLLYESMGKYAAAEPLHQSALKTREKSLGSKHPDTAESLYNLASLHSRMGNTPEAEKYLKRAIAIDEAFDNLDVAASLNALAVLYLSQGALSKAAPLLKRSIAIHERKLGVSHPETTCVINNLAVLCIKLNDLTQAQTLLKKVLIVYEKELGAKHPDTATVLHNLACIHKKQGKYELAESLFQRSFEIREVALGSKHPSTSSSLTEIAVCQTNQKKIGSIATFNRARRAAFHHVAEILPFLPAMEQQSFLESKFEPEFHMAISAALANQSDADAVAKSTEWVVNTKGFGQSALVARNVQSHNFMDFNSDPILKQLQALRVRIATTAMTAVDGSQQFGRDAMIAMLSKDEARLTKELFGAGTSRRETPNWVDLTDIRKSVPSESVLVDIARFDVYDFGNETTGSPWKPAHYAAWIVPPADKGEPRLVDLGLAEEVDAIIYRIRERIQQDAAENGAIRSEGELHAVATLNIGMKKLSDRIWAPLVPFLGQVDSITLCPDGAMWLAPWSALPTGNSDEVLLEKYKLHYVSSGRAILPVKAEKFSTLGPSVFANPSFDCNEKDKRAAISEVLRPISKSSEPTVNRSATKSLLPKALPLPNTASEAQFIGPKIEKLTGEKPKIYQTNHALESVVKQLKRPRIAVFSTHGFYLPGKNEKRDEPVELLSGKNRSLLFEGTRASTINPLLRCGLLFAGCNQHQSIEEDDGILTGLEIAGIDLRGTDLVVLSACDTGIGEVRNAEGVAGLRQAFQLAGAKKIVASLWQVPDRDSAIIMNDFFEKLTVGQAASDALREAQLKRIKVRRERFGAAHPVFWAAWTLTE